MRYLKVKDRKIPLYLAFAVPFTLQVLGVVGLVGYLSYRSGQKAVQAMVDQLIQETENRIAYQLDHYLSLPHRLNQFNVTALESGAISLNDLDTLHQYLIRQHQEFPEVTSLLIGTEQGDFRLVNRVSIAEIEAGFTQFQPGELPLEAGRSDPDDPSELNIYRIDKDRQISRYLETVKNVRAQERPWYRQAAKTEKPGWTKPFQIGVSTVLTINAYRPFYNASGELEGVFSANLSLDRLSQFLSKLTIAETGQVFIIERNGLLIADSADGSSYMISSPLEDREQPGNLEFQRLTAQKSSNVMIKSATTALEKQLGSLELIESSQPIIIEMEKDSNRREAYFLGVMSYQDDYGLDWLVITAVPQSDFMGEITANVRQTIALCSLALLGSLGFGWWTSRRMARSLSDLNTATKKIKTGQFDHTLPKTRIKEVHSLSESFAEMAYSLKEAQKLRDSYEEILKQEVAEKTAALQKSKDKLELITDSIPGCISYIDSSQRYQFVNRTYEVWFNCRREEILGKTVEEVIGQEAYQKVCHYIERVLSGETVSFTDDIPYRGGKTRYISGILVPKIDRSGQVQGYYALITDITAYREAELALAEITQQLQGLLAYAPAAITVFNQEGQYLQVNAAAAQLLGLPESEIVGKSFADFFPEAMAERFRERIQQLATIYQPLQVEDQIAWGEQLKTFESILFPILDEEGEAKQFCAIALDVSDRKQAELALQRSEERFRKIVTASNDAILVLDPQQDTILEANPKATQLFGYSQQELVNSVSISEIYPQEMPKLLEFSQRVLIEGQAWTDELNCCNRQGEQIPVEISASAIEFEQRTCLIAMVRDISERKAAESVLRRQLETIEAAIDGIAIIEGDTYIYLNQAHVQLFGYDYPEELLGRTWRELYPPQERERIEQEILPIVNREGGWQGEAIAVRKDGSTFSEGLSLTFSEEGLLICVCRDITAQKEAEVLMKQQVEMIETSIDGIGLLQGDTYLYLNQAHLKLFGYSEPEELVGKTWRELYSPAEIARFEQKIFPIIEREGYWQGEAMATRKDGSTFTQELSLIVSENGLLICVGRDISDRKAAEQELITAKNAAEMAAQAKSEFLATMSHEIRTPMNGVIGMLSLLEDSSLTPQQRSQLNIAYSSAESLLSLINDILDFSKVDAGKVDLECIEFNLCEQLGEFAKGIALKAQEKGLELILDWRRMTQPMVKGDPGRLRQILMNLVGNAIKFTEQGEIIIQCQVEPVAEDLIFTVSVSDTGIGIPENKIDSLFDPFTQVDASTTRQYGGTGLGLAIVKKLCEQMEGRIDVKSELGKGSCFTVSIKLQPSKQSPPSLPFHELQNQRILLVEDNPTQREVLSKQLQIWGVEVVSARDGKTALSSGSSFTHVFLDLPLADCDAVALAEQLKAQSHPKELKIVMITSLKDQVDVQHFAEVGVTSHLTKPLIPQELLKVLIPPTKVPSTPIPLSQKKPVPKNSLKDSRLLLVEDNPVNCMVVQGILKKRGLELEIANDGTEALILLEQAEETTRTSPSSYYDLILMDCQMPIMDGYETTRKIRAGEAGKNNQNIPIIAMTANAMKGDREKCLVAGMDDYMSKPITPSLLYKMLEKWILSDSYSSEKMIPIFDITALLESVDHEQASAIEICQIFLETLPRELETLQTLCQSRKTNEIECKAYGIAGAAANVGGNRLREIAFEMAQAAREENFSAIGDYLAQLNSQFLSLQNEITKQLQQLIINN